MTGLLHDGRPIVVESERERIGGGPWSRLFATGAVPDERSPVAEHGRRLARAGAVDNVTVAEGRVTGRVSGEHSVTIAAEPVPRRVWREIARSALRTPQLAAAVEGRAQSVHLEHLMTVDWEEPLVPPTSGLIRTCTCGRQACEHLAAVAYVVAHELDRDPSLLLRWRGCVERGPEAPEAPAPAPASPDRWLLQAPLPEPQPPRALPVGTVLKRLGPSGLRVEGVELTEVLERAYAAFAAEPDE